MPILYSHWLVLILFLMWLCIKNKKINTRWPCILGCCCSGMKCTATGRHVCTLSLCPDSCWKSNVFIVNTVLNLCCSMFCFHEVLNRMFVICKIRLLTYGCYSTTNVLVPVAFYICLLSCLMHYCDLPYLSFAVSSFLSLSHMWYCARCLFCWGQASI